ncbi:MAG: hypothetical protein LUE61_00250 [Clostridiales bacterium]|nr:hypothetical protein [Clostridiales bacterium]
MYLPAVQSTTTISGGTITGSSTGIEIRAGSLTVTGGTIIGNGSPNDFEFNGSGTTVIGAGIGVSQHTTNQEIEVTISGGEISGYYGVFEVNTNANNTAKVSISISGDAEVTSTSDDGAAVYSVSVSGADGLSSEASGYYTNDNTDVSITGGTYSTNVSAYCADGTAAVATSDGNYTIVTGTSGTVAIERTTDDTYNYYTSLYAASTGATSGSTITLAADIGTEDGEADDYFRADGKTLTLDLNGHNIYACSGSKSCAVLVTNGATLDIIDSTGSGGVVTTSGTKAVWMISGSLTIDTAGYTWTGASNAVYVSSQASTYETGSTLLTIENGVFYGKSAVAVKNNMGETTINGGVFVGYSTDDTKAIAVAGGSDDKSTVTITGGYFAGSLSAQSSTFAASGGYYLSSVGSTYLATGATCITLSTEEQATVSDGATDTEYQYEVGYSTFTYGYVTYDSETGESTTTTAGGASNLYNLYAGINKMTATLDEDDYVFICLNGDYTGAFDTNSITAYSTIQLDLNGYTLTCESTTAAAITVQSGKTLTIVDSSADETGTVKAASASPYGVVKNRGGVLTIEGGTYINTNESSDLLVNNNGSSGNTASTTITGGYFKNSSGTAFYQLDGTTLTIEGGYFTNDISKSAYLADNYEVATNESETYQYYVADVVYGKNIDLASGKITLNVYVNGTDVSSKDSITASPSVEDSTGNAGISEATDEDATYSYVVTQNVVAKKMADTLTLTITLDNGYAVTYETSVMAYANELLADEDTDTKTSAVLTAMLDYGTAVQELAGYAPYGYANNNGDDTANYSFTMDSTTDADTLKNAATKKTVTSGWTGTTLSSWNMVFDYDFTITMTYKADITSYTVTVMIDEAEYKDIIVSGSTLTISGLSADRLVEKLSVTLTDTSGNTYTTNTTGLYYARLLVQSSSTEVQKRLGKALYLYAEAVSDLNTTTDGE